MSDCKNCKHLVMYDYKNKSYSCELGECEFEPEEQEPTDKNFTKADIDAIVKAINKGWELRVNEILSKIRAEIETEKLEDSPNFCIKAHNNAVDRVLGIVDRYKAEQEAE